MLLLAVAISAAVSAPPAFKNAVCLPIRPNSAAERGKPPLLRKLNELPPGNMYKAVYRRVDGCEVPVVVRYDVGRR